MLGELDVVGHAPKARRAAAEHDDADARAQGGPSAPRARKRRLCSAGAIAQVADAVLRGTPVAEAIGLLHVDGDVLHLEGGLMDVAPEGWNSVRWAGRNLYFGGLGLSSAALTGTLAAAGDPRRGGHGIAVG